MRKTTIGIAGLALLAGCHGSVVDQNRLANTADSLADQADDWGDNASNRVDAASDPTRNRIEGLDNRMARLVDPPAAESWIGDWKGVDGLALTIARDPVRGPNHYLLTDRYARDGKGVFAGTAKGDTLVFTRPDGRQTLRATDGAATGIARLATGKDCLTVGPGEAYCRDRRAT